MTGAAAEGEELEAEEWGSPDKGTQKLKTLVVTTGHRISVTLEYVWRAKYCTRPRVILCLQLHRSAFTILSNPCTWKRPSHGLPNQIQGLARGRSRLGMVEGGGGALMGFKPTQPRGGAVDYPPSPGKTTLVTKECDYFFKMHHQNHSKGWGVETPPPGWRCHPSGFKKSQPLWGEGPPTKRNIIK